MYVQLFAASKQYWNGAAQADLQAMDVESSIKHVKQASLASPLKNGLHSRHEELMNTLVIQTAPGSSEIKEK